MKKIFLMMAAGMLGLLIVGCATLPITKHQPVLPKVNKVFVDDKVEVYKEVEGAWTLKKRFKNRVDNVDPYYQELAEVYVKGLRKELLENGFGVVDKPDQHSLIVRTKIENQPPGLTGILIGGALGAVIAEVEVWQDNKLLLRLDEGGNTSAFHTAKLVIEKYTTPRIAKKLRTQFLE